MFVQSYKSGSLIRAGTGKPAFTGRTSDYSGSMNKFVNNEFNLNANINFGSGKGSSLQGSKGNNESSNNNNNGSNGKGPGRRPHKNGSSKPFYGPTDPNVSIIDYKTGIPSGTLVNDFQDSDPGDHCTMYLMSGSFLPDLIESSPIVGALLDGDIYTRYFIGALMVHQRNKQTFTVSAFREYLSALVDALSIFYSVESVLAYAVNPNNRNSGMLHLRSMLSADAMSQHENLKNELKNYPIPRNLLSFINFMYQSFTFSDTPNSPIYRLEYRHMFRGVERTVSDEDIALAIDRLRRCNEIVAIIKKAFPEMLINDLPPSSPSAIYSKDFRSFWYNSCCTYFNVDSKHAHYSRSVENTETNLYYGHFCEDDIDGIFYACSSAYNKESESIEPGFWVPYINRDSVDPEDSQINSTVVAYDSLSKSLIIPSHTKTAAQAGVHRLYYEEDGKPTLFQSLDASAQRVQSHDLDNTRQAVSASVHHLLIP